MDDLLNPVAPRNPAQQFSNSEDEVPKTILPEGTESIPLPSRGVFYSWDSRYWNMETLACRKLNYADEDILTTRQYFENGTIFNELLKSVIVDNNKFPSTGLVPIDRDTILIWLRSTSFGSLFEIEHTCPECQTPVPISWDLSKLEIPEYPIEVYEELKQNGELSIKTPLKEIKVRIVVPTIGKSIEAEKRAAAKKTAQKTTTDFLGTASLLLILSGIEINGRVERDKNKMDAYLREVNLPISDARYIRKKAEELNLKYNTKQTIVCKNCNHIMEDVEMPIAHRNFFWSDTE